MSNDGYASNSQPGFFTTIDQDTGRIRSFHGENLSLNNGLNLSNEVGPSQGDHISISNPNMPGASAEPYPASSPNPMNWPATDHTKYDYRAQQRGTYNPAPHNPNTTMIGDDPVKPFDNHSFREGERQMASEGSKGPDEQEMLAAKTFAKSFHDLKPADNLYEISQKYLIQAVNHGDQAMVVFKSKGLDRTSFVMQKHELSMAKAPTLDEVRHALKVSQAKWGNELNIEGPKDFMDLVSLVMKIDKLPIVNTASPVEAVAFPVEAAASSSYQDMTQMRANDRLERDRARMLQSMINSVNKKTTRKNGVPKPPKMHR